MRASDRSKRLEVVCGGEAGLLDPALYGPGGGSRCIQFGEHLLTPIEFEALAGKKTRNWKFNLKVDGKPIKALFENNILTSCERNCSCPNCVIGRKYPTDLDLLIEKVYLNKTYDLSIVKKEKEDPKTGKMLEKPEDTCDLKDEIFSSPETTPKKKQKKRSSMETPVDEILPVANNSPTTSEQSKTIEVTSPIHVVTSHPDPDTVAPILDREELTPGKRQKDIRSFFGKSPRTKIADAPKSPGAKSDSSVELIAEGRPKRNVMEVDLTENQDLKKTPKKRGPGRPPRSASAASGSLEKEKPEDLLTILRQEKKRALSPRKRLPRDAKTTTSEEKTVKDGKTSPNNSDQNINSNGLGKRKVNAQEDETVAKKKKVTNKDPKEKEETPLVSAKITRKATNPKSEKEHITNGSLESPVKLEPVSEAPLSPGPSPSKVPTYTTMVRAALEDMNCVGGEGCTKLEILLYILRKFKPKGNVEQVTTKLIQVLETGTKRGDFLSSVSCPRVLKRDNNKEVKKESNIKTEPKENGIKKEASKPGPKKMTNQKSVKKGASGMKSKDKFNGKSEEKKNPTKNQPVVKKLLEPLSTICKAKKLTRQEALRKIKAYIKLKKLQDTKDKNVIICDEQLKKMTKCKKIQQSALMSHIKPYMIPILKKK